MAEQMRVNQPIDWSNPNDPKTKEALNLLFHALVEENLIAVEIRHILTALYLTEKREDLQRSEELAAHADQEIKKFWETLRPDASQAMKTKDKEALSLCLNAVSEKIADLQNQNSELSVSINKHQHDIASVAAAWKARELQVRAELVSKLEGKLTDKSGEVVTAARLTEVLKQAAPADIDKRLGQKDLHAKIESLLKDLGPIDRTLLFQQMARGQAHLTQLRICAELYKEDGEMPTGPKLLEAVKNLKELGDLMAEMMKNGGNIQDAADMLAVHLGHKEIFACQKKIEENEKKITVFKGAEKSLQSSLNALENINANHEHEHAAKPSNIPEAPPPPPVMRRK